jgi:hypothetical protein
MITRENCGFSDVIWSNGWWKCSVCQQVMNQNYEKEIQQYELELLLLRKAQEK